MFDETAFLDKTEGHIKSKLPTISTDRCEYNKIEDVSLSLSLYFYYFFFSFFLGLFWPWFDRTRRIWIAIWTESKRHRSTS